jgi:hypothetical protein
MSGAEPGRSWDGYTRAENVPGEDGKAVSKEFAYCWPAGTPGIGAATKPAPGGVQHPSRTAVYDPPAPGSTKRRKRPVPGGAK